MNREDLDILLHEGEGSMLEYKESLSSSFARDLVVFANSTGGKILPTSKKIHRITGEVRGEVGTKLGPSGEQVTEQVTEQVAAILGAARVPRTRAELQEVSGLKHRPHFIKAYLEPLLAAGWLEMTVPDRPRSSKQRYRTTDLGLKVLRQRQGEK